jgi:hypothetical protein
MTVKPEAVSPPKPPKDQKDLPEELSLEFHPLENLFYLGYAESPIIEVFKEDTVELKVQFRTLTPLEIRDITEAISLYDSSPAQMITERIETLARSIISINHMPLILTTKERQEFYEKNGRNPSPLEMSKIILQEKIRSMVVIDAIYEKYLEFSDSILNDLEKIKKKSNN